METVYDKGGNPIRVGDYIVYGHAKGRSAALRFGKVLDLKERKHKWKDEIEGVTITVIGVNDDWGHREPKLLSKKSSLMFPNRVMVIPWNSLPAKVRDLFDEYPSCPTEDSTP